MPFTEPPRTRYDINFSILGVPVRVHPLFWLMALFFGLASGSITQLLIWVVAVFISILVHELGHSIAMRRYGLDSHIVLYIFGGLAIPYGSRRGSASRTTNEQIIISFAGPLAGFLLASLIVALVLAFGGSVFLSRILVIIPLPVAILPGGPWLLNSIIRTFLWINIFWGIINLMPVIPLDGGNISRAIFVKVDPWDGVRKSLQLSVISGVILAVAGFLLLRSPFMVFLFGLLAFQSYQLLQGRSGNMF